MANHPNRSRAAATDYLIAERSKAMPGALADSLIRDVLAGSELDAGHCYGGLIQALMLTGQKHVGVVKFSNAWRRWYTDKSV